MGSAEHVEYLEHIEGSQGRFYSMKTFGASEGISACFRQAGAKSHCRYLHGYALEFRFNFGCHHLNDTNWAVDFGDFKVLKEMIKQMFDHKTLVAENDPQLAFFQEAHKLGVIDLVVVQATGCEKFAELAFQMADQWLEAGGYKPRCWVEFVECREHSGNAAFYRNLQAR